MATAAAPGSTIYRRSGTTWTLDQTLMPADYAMGTGDAQAVLYRDNVLITVEGMAQESLWAGPHLYVPDANGKFQNAGILDARGNTFDIDVSKGTVVAASEDQFGIVELAVFELPTPLMPPKAIVNDFNTRDVSGFQTTPAGAYQLAGSGSQWFYRQPSTAGDTEAVVTGSDWSGYQSVDVRIQPWNLTNLGQWVGAAVRYIDADNYYFMSIYYDRMAVNRRLNGVNTELASIPLEGALFNMNFNRFRDFRFGISRGSCQPCGGDEISATLRTSDRVFSVSGYDKSLTHGRAALLTHNLRADFDNLRVSPSSRYGLLFMNFFDNPGRPLETNGGTWTEEEYGIRQSDQGVLAIAVGGAPIDDQLSGRQFAWSHLEVRTRCRGSA